MSNFKFSVGTWNVHTGADSYGPEIRQAIDLEAKFARFKALGFDAIQFHDDDAVPDMNNMTVEEIKEYARGVKKLLDKYGLKAEFVAPRLWMDPHTKDGGFMSTNAEDREFAMWRAYRSIDIAKELGTDLLVLWLAREGTLCAESKNTPLGQLSSLWRQSTECSLTMRTSVSASSPNLTSLSTAPSAALLDM